MSEFVIKNATNNAQLQTVFDSNGQGIEISGTY